MGVSYSHVTLYKTYQKLSKTRSNTFTRDQIQIRSPADIAKHEKHLAAEGEFKQSLNCLFDLKALNQPFTVKEEDLVFYNLQKQQSRIGTISVLDCEAARIAIDKEKKELRKRQRVEEVNQEREDPMVPFASSSSSSGNSQESLGRCTRSGHKQVPDDDDQFVYKPRLQGKLRNFDDVFCGIMERHNMASRPVHQLIVNVLEKLNVPLDCVVHNDQTLLRNRKKSRADVANEEIANFDMEQAIVHWDDKKFQDKNDVWFEHIVVFVFWSSKNQVLGCEVIEENGKPIKATGLKISYAVYKVLQMWSIDREIVGFSFDTTGTNTGYRKGACKYLKGHFEDKPILLLPCRHHCKVCLLILCRDVPACAAAGRAVMFLVVLENIFKIICDLTAS